VPDTKGINKTLLGIAVTAITLLVGGVTAMSSSLRAADIQKVDTHIKDSAADFRTDTENIRNNLVQIKVISQRADDIDNDIKELKSIQYQANENIQQLIIEVTKIGSHIEREH
tara:strand:+ start:213 stop:551 length:339 start_codon:yes stop_codon:yes gene_type:complete